MTEVRWKQRFSNFKSAFNQLEAAISISRSRTLSDLEQQGLIQAFEFTHELAWNVIKDYFQYQGNTMITGSRDASREAFRMGLIENGEAWMQMIQSRNETSHTYNKSTAQEICKLITESYFNEFQKLKDTFEKK